MTNYEFINNKFAEPAIILSVKDNELSVLDVNDQLLKELEVTNTKHYFLEHYMEYQFDESYYNFLKSSIIDCLESGKESVIEIKCVQIYVRARLLPLDEHTVFMGVRNVTAEKSNTDALSDSIIEALAGAYDMITLVDYENNKITPIKDNANAQVNDLTDFESSMKVFLESFEVAGGEDISKFADLNYLKNEMFIGTDKRQVDFREKHIGLWLHNEYIVLERKGNSVTKVLTTSSVMDKDAARKFEAERIIKQQKKELEIAVEAANHANRAKSDFLARMSHEIRTPMNAIMGMNEIIIKSADDPLIKGYADDAYKAATGLLGTINEILDFSKIESGKMELVEDDFYLSPFIGNLYTMFALRAEDKNLALIFDIDENLPCGLYGDDTHIRQVLVNLLSNAVKYTEKGSITFKITEKGRMGQNGSERISLLFSVKDTGRGIKEEDIKKLFEAFERFDLKENKSIEGTGLGMNIVSGLLELMGSSLKVESEYGRGTTFSFEMSLGISNSSPLGDFRRSLDKKVMSTSVNLYVNPDKKVLVVDDNSVNLKVIKALLKATKVMVDTATSGAEALEMTLDNKYDLIFLDHYMPEMDGIETMDRLREQKGKNIDTPVIALTANAIKGAENIYSEHGFKETVFKPTTQQALSDALKKYLCY